MKFALLTLAGLLVATLAREQADVAKPNLRWDANAQRAVNEEALDIAHKMITGEAPNSIPCTICTKVIGFVEGKVTKYGCGLIFDGIAAAACEAAGLGPEDPLSEACIAFVIAGCGEIAKLLAEHVKSPHDICHHLHAC